MAAIQSMKFAKSIALACLGLTIILGLFVMVNTGYQRCDCRYPSENGVLESRNNNPFFEPLVSDPSSSDSKTKRLPIRIQMEGDASVSIARIRIRIRRRRNLLSWNELN